MTQLRKRALLTILIWGIVSIGFGATILSAGGPSTYADDQSRRVIGGIFLALGFLGSPVMLYLTRVRKGANHLVSDERDDRISLQATRGSMVVVLVYVFFTCIALWEAYAEPGSVPVGWMWFLAYSTAILSYLVPAVATLIIDYGMVTDG